MAITNIAGNTFSQIYGASKNERASGYIPVTVPITANTAANSNSYWGVVKFAAFPGNVKLKLIAGWWQQGNVNSANTNATIFIKNFTNAGDTMGSAAFGANSGVYAGDTNYTPLSLTLATTTSDRSAVAGMTSTEPDVNAAPGDALYVQVQTVILTTVTPGTVIMWFQPVDITAAGA